jgi:chromosome partitioning protein
MPNENMKVIAIMTRKGGAGKTTLARAIISAMLADGKRCIAVDADPQNALHRWWDRVNKKNPNLAKETPDLTVISIDAPAELETIIEDAYEQNTADFIVIDTLGAGGAWADDLAVHSDNIVLPIMLTETDMAIATDTHDWFKGLHERAEDPSQLPKLSVVLSRVDRAPSKAMLAVAKEANQYFPVIPELFMERKQHADVDREGLLHQVADARRANTSGLLRTHAKHFDEALDEARAILKAILEAV